MKYQVELEELDELGSCCFYLVGSFGHDLDGKNVPLQVTTGQVRLGISSNFQMLLKIDHLNCPSAEPIFLSLTTESREEYGKDSILVTIGRDKGDIQFNSSKAVSRAHCVLRLTSDETVSNASIPRTYLVVEDMGRYSPSLLILKFIH
jgi:hypothetical protein